jgi:hypothetical protein
MLSSGANVIIWDKMLSCEANVVMLSFGANVIIWCYHVMLSSGMITPPFLFFPENFTHSFSTDSAKEQYLKFEINIPRKGIAWPQSQFPHSCVCERFIYSHDQSAYSGAGNMWTNPGNIYINRSPDT